MIPVSAGTFPYRVTLMLRPEMQEPHPTRAGFACFGELLLRLSAPSNELLLQSGSLNVHIGGAEANVAVSLARWGHKALMASVVPDSPLGKACIGELRRHGVRT